MKKIVIALSLGLFLSIFTLNSARAASIGFIDTIKILQESKHGIAAIKKLETTQAKSITQLEELTKQREEAEKAKDTEKVELLTSEMQAIAYSAQNELQAMQESIFGVISVELEAIVKEYRAKKGLTVIFNHTDVIAFDPAADITDDIMLEFNKKVLDFDKKQENKQ